MVSTSGNTSGTIGQTIGELLEQRQGIKDSTLCMYRRMVKPVYDLALDDPRVGRFIEDIPNPNVRRTAIFALSSIGYDYKRKLPKALPRRYELPDEETLRLLLSYTAHENTLLTCMYLGLRLGEACYVNKTQLLPGNRIYIDRQVVEYNDGIGKTHMVYKYGEPKNGPAEIDCPPWIAELLPDKPRPIERCLKPAVVRVNMWQKSRQLLGYSLPPHALRHWMITQMVLRNVPVTVIQRQARHANIQTTLNVYSQTMATRMDIFDY